MIYFNGTVGNICLIAEAKSVTITSASCVTKMKAEEIKSHKVNGMKKKKEMLNKRYNLHKTLTELKLPASPDVTNE